MDDSPLVERVEPLAELRGEVERLLDVERADGAQPVTQRAAGVERHDEVAGGLVQLEDRDEVARPRLAREPRLAGEPAPRRVADARLRAQELHRDELAALVPCAVDDAGRAFADDLFEAVPHALIIPVG